MVRLLPSSFEQASDLTTRSDFVRIGECDNDWRRTGKLYMLRALFVVVELRRLDAGV